jgi:hypothetical protein
MYWHKKMGGLIQEIKKRNGGSFSKARHYLANRMASIELIPYHSQTFKAKGNFIRDIPSANLAREYVKNTIIPRVKEGKAIVIATRQHKNWGLPKKLSGVIQYDGPGEAQSAHLTPGSKGGKAILNFLKL